MCILSIDPEFSMKTGAKPGSVIGSFDAADINYVTNYLAKIVKDNNLPPQGAGRTPFHTSHGDQLQEY